VGASGESRRRDQFAATGRRTVDDDGAPIAETVEALRLISVDKPHLSASAEVGSRNLVDVPNSARAETKTALFQVLEHSDSRAADGAGRADDADSAIGPQFGTADRSAVISSTSLA
jgi:hypothetical protein